MSKFEWERGDIVIPSTEWAGFKAKIRDAMNKANARRYELALKIHEHLSKNHKSLRGYDAFQEATDFGFSKSKSPSLYVDARYRDDDIEPAVNALFPNGWYDKSKRPMKPKKNQFPIYGNNVNTLEDADCSLVFDNETRTARWSVHENNHAVERARNSDLGRVFFATLGKVKWTRGSGGVMYGNDEYNRHSGSGPGGGGNYTTGSFGPNQKKPTAVMGYNAPSVSLSRRW